MQSKLLTCAALIAASGSLAAKTLERPNIIWISAEDTSQCRWSCYGDPI